MPPTSWRGVSYLTSVPPYREEQPTGSHSNVPEAAARMKSLRSPLRSNRSPRPLYSLAELSSVTAILCGASALTPSLKPTQASDAVRGSHITGGRHLSWNADPAEITCQVPRLSVRRAACLSGICFQYRRLRILELPNVQLNLLAQMKIALQDLRSPAHSRILNDIWVARNDFESSLLPSNGQCFRWFATGLVQKTAPLVPRCNLHITFRRTSCPTNLVAQHKRNFMDRDGPFHGLYGRCRGRPPELGGAEIVSS